MATRSRYSLGRVVKSRIDSRRFTVYITHSGRVALKQTARFVRRQAAVDYGRMLARSLNVGRGG